MTKYNAIHDPNLETAPSRKKDVIAYKENPFWKPQEIQVGKKRITVSGGMHVDQGSGESIQHSGIHIIKEVDGEEFLKLYTRNVKAIFDLKPTSQRVLQYIMAELQRTPNADAIYLAWLSADEYFSEYDLKVSRPSFHRALKELMEKGFIAESHKPNMVWFNPHLFFNGDRMSFVNEYRKKPKIEDINN